MTEENKEHVMDGVRGGVIGKQIQLPLSKAVEISVKSLKVRFWRSMLTVVSIILAIAFLTFVWCSSRVESAVAVGLDPDFKKATAVGQTVDETWKPLEILLEDRFGAAGGGKRAFADNVKELYVGKVGDFRQFCQDWQMENNEKKRVNLSGLDEALPEGRKISAGKIDKLAALVRDELGVKVDLDGWVVERTVPVKDSEKMADYRTDDVMRLAAVKGAVQGEIERLANVQVALQRRGIKPGTPVAELKKMSPTTVWLIIISLMVCGVGITNAMLMSVTERFREIGTMKCLGALDSFIVKLFLLESTFQGVAGTMIGVVLGFLIMLAMSSLSFGWAALQYFPTGQVLLTLLYAFVIGSALSIIGAVFPALRAAQMAPVEAMRVEE